MKRRKRIYSKVNDTFISSKFQHDHWACKPTNSISFYFPINTCFFFCLFFPIYSFVSNAQCSGKHPDSWPTKETTSSTYLQPLWTWLVRWLGQNCKPLSPRTVIEAVFHVSVIISFSHIKKVVIFVSLQRVNHHLLP